MQRKLVARPMVTALDVVGRQLVVARKAAEGLPRVMPIGAWGWLRPLSISGSAITGEGTVVTYDRNPAEMVPDERLSGLWRSVWPTPVATTPSTS